MTDRRLEALRVFRDTPAPNRHDEVWRRVDLSQFKLDQSWPSHRRAGARTAAHAGRRTRAGQAAAHRRATQRIGRLEPSLVAAGRDLHSLCRAIQQHQELLDQYLMTQCVKLTDSYFAALHGVFMRGGAVLYVPKGVQHRATAARGDLDERRPAHRFQPHADRAGRGR